MTVNSTFGRFADIVSYLGGHIPKCHPKGSVKRHFQSKLAKH